MTKTAAGLFLIVARLSLITAALPPASAQATRASAESIPRELRRLGLVPAAGARRDPATGLPTRVLHRPSRIVLALIPPGEFRMGSPGGEPDRGAEERAHRRVIRRPFYLGETEVTVGQFRRFVRATRYLTDAERGVEEAGHRRGAFATTAGRCRDRSHRRKIGRLINLCNNHCILGRVGLISRLWASSAFPPPARHTDTEPPSGSLLRREWRSG